MLGSFGYTRLFSHTRLDRASGSPIVVGDDSAIVVWDDRGVLVGDGCGVAILDILLGYADVVIGNVYFPSFLQSQFLSL